MPLNTRIYFAPLQSFTTIPYYLAYAKIVGGVDKYFTPFYRVEKDGKFSFDKQLCTQSTINLIPQVLTNEGSALVSFASQMVERGFKEINLNLGCPFPMVVNRQLGSGLLPYPEKVEQMLQCFYAQNIPIKLSIKLRLGLKAPMELKSIVDVLNRYPVEELILHPRLGVQKYKGVPDWTLFDEHCNQANWVGNGDITSLLRLKELESQFVDVKAWMIGRGLLMNPCMLQPQLNWKDTMVGLHDLFLDNLRSFGLSDHQILNQLKCFWEYPSMYQDGGLRLYRKMKKVGKIEDYQILKEKLLELV